MHKGEVLAYNAEKGHHLVFYDDGEDEWVDLSLQHVTWHEHVRGVTVAHGLPAGNIPQAPLHYISCNDRQDNCQAYGWKVACFCSLSWVQVS